MNAQKIISPIHYLNEKDLKNDYFKNGYVSIKNLIPHDLINQLNRDLCVTFKKYATNEKYEFDSAVINLNITDKPLLYNLHCATVKLTSIVKISEVLARVVKLISEDDSPVLEISTGYLLGLPKDKRLAYDFHQESNYMKGFGSVYNFHYPILRKSTIENGTMSVLVGSHQVGTLPYRKSKASSDSYTDLIPLNISELSKNYEEKFCELDLGDCFIFHKDLIHKSNFNNSELLRAVGISRMTQDLMGDFVHRESTEL